MQKYLIEIKWGVIFALFSMVWMLGERLVGLHDALIAHHATWTNLIAIPAILIYVFALRDKRENHYGGKMRWTQGFISGAIVTLVVAVLAPLTQFINSTIITPNYFTNVIEYTVAAGLSSREEAEAFFNLGNYVLLAPIGALVMGLVTSAIVAIFVRRS